MYLTHFVVLESVRLVSELMHGYESMTILSPDDETKIKVGQLVTPSH